MSKCAICLSNFLFRWTDTHGVAICVTCGAPYKLLHYDPDDHSPVRKPPELLLSGQNLDIYTRYYRETGHRLPAIFDIGPTISGPSYSGITPMEQQSWNTWWLAHKDEYPSGT